MTLGLCSTVDAIPASPVESPRKAETLLDYIRRKHGEFDVTAYKQLLGAANEFKEGDAIVGVAAVDDESRRHARQLLQQTTLGDIQNTPPYRDELLRYITASVDAPTASRLSNWTVGDLKTFLLEQPEVAIQEIISGLHSDVIGCVVKLMNNDELVRVGAKVFHPLPGTQIGARGYLGARVQPNSPTDNLEDIRWQVFNAFAYAVGDVLLGTNPVSSNPKTVAQVERTLQDVLTTFQIEKLLPHCVLSHIDVQREVERMDPGSTELWFQSIAGTDGANGTFDVSVEKMREIASTRTGPYGLYFETGQGADFTNGHGQGFDMVLHESRKYGFARALQQQVAEARFRAGKGRSAWVHVNDVAGFIGPEVFRTREQLVRCCLEDIMMGKLHGLCLGLDVCSTLHMDVSLDDLDWCLDQILPANPAYLMALPTKIDPMLGYLTTGFQDHVRAREKFGFQVNDAMWKFFQRLGVVDDRDQPTQHFGDPAWVYLQYCRRRGDARSEGEIRRDAEAQMQRVRDRGLFLATGHGDTIADLDPNLRKQVFQIYADGKESIWAELQSDFVKTIPTNRQLVTQSKDRTDYILHPESGEQLSESAVQTLDQIAAKRQSDIDVQIVISDGLNAHSIMDEGQLLPFLRRLRQRLAQEGHIVAPEHIVVRAGRVRAGYRIGERLFEDSQGRRALLHVIGERPGTGHHTFSVYVTALDASDWQKKGTVDHNVTKVVSGIALTALPPSEGADETVRVLKTLV